MELSFSPDIETYYCYAIVFVAGAFVGVSQIRRRIGKIEGIWSLPRTWWLFSVYVGIPVLLFWFLDRASGITDTSVFAAVLVGFGYERIINGGDQTIKPTNVSQIWSPFLAYADRISAQVQDEDARRRRRVADRIVALVGVDNGLIAKLEVLARRYAPDIQALDKQLTEIAAMVPSRGEAAAKEEKVRALYNSMLTVPDRHDLMLEHEIIDRWIYWLDVRGARSMARIAFCVIAVLVVVAVIVLKLWQPNMKEKMADYYIWRIEKTNSTATDQFRARQNLTLLLREEGDALHRAVNESLVALLQRPTLPMARLDAALQTILLNSRSIVGQAAPQMPLMLVGALRVESLDARTRVNDALKFMASFCKAPIHAELTGWKPPDGDSTATLAGRIKRWTDYWANKCETRGDGT